MQEERMPWPEWRIIKRLGSGGFGRVYEIERDDGFGHAEKAAMKVIPIPKEESDIDSMRAEGYTDMEISEGYRRSLEQVLKEYALMSELKGHPNIVACEDRAAERQDNGIGWNVYIRMELLKPFVSEARERSYDAGDAVRLGKDLCRAVMACHGKNIVHRDIKPENVFVTGYGDYKLGDFGIARTMEHTTRATVTGTPYYMAPEVCREEPYGKEADIYSLGLVMYWLMNGRRLPFLPAGRVPSAEERLEAYKRRIRGEKIKEPREGDGELKRIILKAVSYKPGDRYPSAGEMLADLEKWEKANDSLSSTLGKAWGTDNLTGGKEKDKDWHPPGWVPKINYKEFALQGGNRKPARADKPGKQLVFMAFATHVGNTPSRYMYYEGNTLEREYKCQPHNCVHHPIDYFGETRIIISDSEHEMLENAVKSFVDKVMPNKGNFISKEAYLEALYSDGERVVINNILCDVNNISNSEEQKQYFRKSNIANYLVEDFSSKIDNIFEKVLKKTDSENTVHIVNRDNKRQTKPTTGSWKQAFWYIVIMLLLFSLVVLMEMKTDDTSNQSSSHYNAPTPITLPDLTLPDLDIPFYTPTPVTIPDSVFPTFTPITTIPESNE